jgi:hypothetical protein
MEVAFRNIESQIAYTLAISNVVNGNDTGFAERVAMTRARTRGRVDVLRPEIERNPPGAAIIRQIVGQLGGRA